MLFVHTDGGRKAAGYKGSTGDCACRAISIATGMPYKETYTLLNTFAAEEKPSKRRRGKSSARTGFHSHTLRKVMDSLGWTWVPTMEFGKGCTTHMRSSELPTGNIVVRLSKHYAAVIDHVLHDSHDCARDGTRCVYGYWTLTE